MMEGDVRLVLDQRIGVERERFELVPRIPDQAPAATGGVLEDAGDSDQVQRHTGARDIPDRLGIELGHAVPAVRLLNEQTVLNEEIERLPQGGSAHAQGG